MYTLRLIHRAFCSRRTGRGSVDVKCHVLFFSVCHVQQIRSDWSLRRISTEIQHDHSQHGEDYTYWLSPLLIT